MDKIKLFDWHQLLNEKYWTGQIPYVILGIITLMVIPYLCAYVIAKLGNVPRKMFAQLFGAQTQAISGGFGAFLHEFSHITLGFISGFSLKTIKIQSLWNFRKTGAMGDIDQDWYPSNFYQKLMCFWLGIAPFFMTSWVLLEIQELLSKDVVFTGVVRFAHRPSTSEMMQSITSKAFDGLTGAFSTSNFFFSLIFIVIVLLSVIQGYSLTNSDLLTSVSSIPYWIIGIILISLGFGAALQSIIFASWAITFANFTIFFAWRALIYLLIALGVVSIFKLIEKITDNG